MHAPNYVPDDGLVYRTIHNVDIQQERQIRTVPCGPGGTIHDYVPFYLGCRSPMLLQLCTGRVPGYDEGQTPLIYLVSTVATIKQAELDFVFSDGHGIAAYTQWFDDTADLDKVDWRAVYATYWEDTPDDPDRQRRKQAELLVHRFCPWSVVKAICVRDDTAKRKAEGVLEQQGVSTSVSIRTRWYYDHGD